ncbi:MAG TPA: glycosyltransferase, partial [Gemmatimonadaceae bacterium]|nr:glycosyltransferase [Gemmatimonadaceae bacterium]
LSPEKGADLLLQALRGADPMRAVIVGDGEERPRLERLAAELGVADRVTFAGFRAAAADLLPAFDVLALSSRTEGTPMVLLESVSAGIPIVSFAVGGIPDLLDEQSAWLVPPLDVNGLRVALGAALVSAPERAARASAARQRLSERLSPERWLARISLVYDQAARVARRESQAGDRTT